MNSGSKGVKSPKLFSLSTDSSVVLSTTVPGTVLCISTVVLSLVKIVRIKPEICAEGIKAELYTVRLVGGSNREMKVVQQRWRPSQPVSAEDIQPVIDLHPALLNLLNGFHEPLVVSHLNFSAFCVCINNFQLLCLCYKAQLKQLFVKACATTIPMRLGLCAKCK